MATWTPEQYAAFAEPKVTLLSRLNYPVNISYGNELIRISPRGVTNPLFKRLLGTLPNGVVMRDCMPKHHHVPAKPKVMAAPAPSVPSPAPPAPPAPKPVAAAPVVKAAGSSGASGNSGGAPGSSGTSSSPPVTAS